MICIALYNGVHTSLVLGVQVWVGYHPSREWISMHNAILTQTTVFLEGKERMAPRALGKKVYFSQSLCPPLSLLSSYQTQLQCCCRWKRCVRFCINMLESSQEIWAPLNPRGALSWAAGVTSQHQPAVLPSPRCFPHTDVMTNVTRKERRGQKYIWSIFSNISRGAGGNGEKPLSFKRKGLKGNWELLKKLSGTLLELNMYFQKKKTQIV